MKKNLLTGLGKLLSEIEVSGPGLKTAGFDNAVSRIVRVVSRMGGGNKIMLVGNGGSASIASHIVTDFIKNLKIPALAFNDASLITCVSNDLGYEHVFSMPIGILAGRGDVLFAVSSSGKSKNILNAVFEARKKGAFIITLSGFSPGNPLRNTGDVNFYTPSSSYGDVESSHLAICHAIVDIFTVKNENG